MQMQRSTTKEYRVNQSENEIIKHDQLLNMIIIKHDHHLMHVAIASEQHAPNASGHVHDLALNVSEV